MSRYLDPDEDYQYHPLNQPAAKLFKPEVTLEMEAKAKRCLRFVPNPYFSGICLTCSCARYAHSEYALRSL